MGNFDFSTLVIDRSKADLDSLIALLKKPPETWTEAELAEFDLARSKGAYNYTDLNRVTTCMDYLNERLQELGYATGYQPIIVHPAEKDLSTLLLLHGDSIVDSSMYDVPITNNGVVVSDAQSKFGGKSLYFNGTAYLTLAELIPQNGDFTVDWWEYVTGNSATRFSQSINGGCGGIVAGGGSSANALYVSSTGSTWDIVSGVSAFSGTADTWVHWALVRKDNVWTTYRNGTQFAQATGAGTMYSNGAGLVIGSFLYDANHYFVGYMDEFRISNVARWTSDFTPPTEPYADEKIDITPTMTSDTTPQGYVVSASSVLAGNGEGAWQAFDGTLATAGNLDFWHSEPGMPQWIMLQFPTAQKVTKFSITNSPDIDSYKRYGPLQFSLQGSNDGTVFDTLGTYQSDGALGQSDDYEVELPGEYLYYRVYITQAGYEYSGQQYAVIDQIRLYTTNDPVDPYTWIEGDVPTATQLARYLDNVSALRGVLTLPEGTADVPEDMVGLTQQEANAIEEILGIIELWINNMTAAWFYSGDLYCGEV